ncbi:SMI1/KNR4 family protein [bacterium]|nr:MAG: SMI1/KNR4 family protein [bacterium]
MVVLSEFHSDFSIAASRPAATDDEVIQLRALSQINVPDEYVELITAATELEISVRGESYIRIWGPTGAVEMNESYNIQSFIPLSLAVGDDEGGNALLYMTGKRGFGLYLAGFGDLDVDDATFLATSLRNLLVNGCGVDTILSGGI